MSLTETRATEPLPGSPRATRHHGSAWRDPRLLVGVVLVAGSALVGATLLSDEETVDVWATREALTAGEPLRADGLVRREVRFADQADADRYLTAHQPLPVGASLTRDVGAGELLPRAAVAADQASTVVEVPLRVPGEAVPLTVRAGSVVDVWVTPDPALAPADDAAGPARLVLEGVRVLAVSRGGGALGASAERQVIVGLDATQERGLAGALTDLARGEVVLVRTP